MFHRTKCLFPAAAFWIFPANQKKGISNPETVSPIRLKCLCLSSHLLPWFMLTMEAAFVSVQSKVEMIKMHHFLFSDSEVFFNVWGVGCFWWVSEPWADVCRSCEFWHQPLKYHCNNRSIDHRPAVASPALFSVFLKDVVRGRFCCREVGALQE